MNDAYRRRDVLGLLGVALLGSSRSPVGVSPGAPVAPLSPWRSLPAVVSQKTSTAARFDSLIESMASDPSEWIVGVGSKLWSALRAYDGRGQTLASVCRARGIHAVCELDCQRNPDGRGPGDHFVELVAYADEQSAQQGWGQSKRYLLDQGGEVLRLNDIEIILVSPGEWIAQPKAFMRVANTSVCVVEPFSPTPNPRAFARQCGKVLRSFLADPRKGEQSLAAESR